MNQITKKILVSMGILSITMLSGCGSSNPKKDTNKEKPVEKVDLIANEYYVEPLNPTVAQTKAYNKLSDAIEKVNSEEEAKMVAVNFVFDFFTLSNKASAEDLGGLQFIPSDNIKRFMEFGKSYYYSNYSAIVNDYGKKSLPEVATYKVASMEPTIFNYNQSECNGYTIKLSITYADTDIPTSNLKTEMTIHVVELQDYDYDRTKDYSGDVAYEGEMKNVYRVLAVED